MRSILSVFLLVGFSFAATAQSAKIKGSVTTTTNTPLSGATIELSQTTLGTTTDENGNFILSNIPSGNYRLMLSYVGFKTKYVDLSVSENTTKDLGAFQLEEAQEMLGVISINGKKHNKFTRETSVSVSKMPLADIENPQVYNSITASLLEEQVITNFDDALKNAPGIDKLWESTGRGNDGAGYYSLRGFAVQPTLTNGLPALTNGSPDPANIESIEVIKGPSGTLYGSSLISYGGLINITTKRPFYDFGGSVSYTSGSYGLNRVTADVNTTLSKEKNIALRVNTAYHTQNSYQDAGFRKSFFFAPSLAYQVNDRLSFYINTEFYKGKSTNQTMLFLDRGAQLRVNTIDELGYDIDRSYTGNDLYIETPTYSFQGQMNYKLSDNWTSQTAFSRSNSKSDGYYSYLYEGTQYTTLDEGIALNRYISKQNSETIATDIQQNFIGDFNLGSMRNRMVVGLDYLKTNVINNNSPYITNGAIYIGNNLQEFNEEVLGITDPANFTDDSGVLTQAGTDALLANGTINPSKTEQEIFSAYASDVINILPELSAMASLRIDRFSNADHAQTALSPKFGVVYQPILNKVSLFANYMNGFSNVAPVDEVTNGVTTNRALDPEHANQFEAGTKLNLLNGRLSATLSYYDIQVRDRALRVDVDATNYFYTQDGTQESKGFEASFVANPVDGLNIVAGYSYNDSKLTEGAADFVGLRPESAGPQNLANLWASYQLTSGKFEGLGFGFGGNYASENKIFNRNLGGAFTLPEYTVVNASVFYGTPDFRISLKLDNIANKEYFKGWSTISPQNQRSLLANFTYNF
ncbi:MAG: TonB-dependent siderophore receptor [Leeuwenhoekiella sp.]|jgi:iron complex outermembrane receptor protein|uniref:TonB-dependent receptor n=1 Tax=Leeuwenhoekiella TaxID=283735 RepID=UPI000C4B2609|nr:MULTISPECIES: TonB-dependent receptor [Leeuwenhoekiella]MAO43848.1 TonB-dependent siderophore receptor [Leeuwenhoekiella sp.]MBQ50651.1 TonB-dependent siderophore receptor [Leeuwenhoekiella sp.]HCW64057.1 TonB-dependent siderophore receptor [Leeuwenhoekiella sp.]|tara:strand:+ start:623 stop:3049 length:2427 start_codon:yes stop_codon:yes gene_type:complete